MRKQFLPDIAFGFIFAFALLFSGCDLSPKYSVYFYSTNDKNAMLSSLTQSDLSPGTAITLPSGAEAWHHKNNGNRQYFPGDSFTVDDNATFIASDWTGGADDPGGTSPGSAITLTQGSWTTSSIASKTETKTFIIPATSSSRTVTVYWLDYNIYTPYADIKVQFGGSTYEATTFSGFNGVSCFSAPYSLSAGETGTITVSWYSDRNRTSNGSFRIGYN
ncbi:hypothetical protein AGMMS4952_03160 [Spirochaetia bacterium]|nr:hypothetical protein AGMMS4952_03160 [Spirochaetia bacterium]